MLIKGLPREALVRIPVGERGQEPWTAYHELLAQLVEVTSIGAAEHKLKKPIKVPRPQQPQPAAAQGGGYRAAVGRLTGGARPTGRRAGGGDTGGDTGGDSPAFRAAMSRLAGGRTDRLRVIPGGGSEGQETA